MKTNLIQRKAAAIAAAALMSASCIAGTTGAPTLFMPENTLTVSAAESSVKVLASVGYGEGMYATWSSVSGASGYNVYVDGTQIDSMLIRQYPGYMRADAVGLKAGSHTMKIVPIISGKEDSSKAAEAKAIADKKAANLAAEKQYNEAKAKAIAEKKAAAEAEAKAAEEAAAAEAKAAEEATEAAAEEATEEAPAEAQEETPAEA